MVLARFEGSALAEPKPEDTVAFVGYDPGREPGAESGPAAVAAPDALSGATGRIDRLESRTRPTTAMANDPLIVARCIGAGACLAGRWRSAAAAPYKWKAALTLSGPYVSIADQNRKTRLSRSDAHGQEERAWASPNPISAPYRSTISTT